MVFCLLVIGDSRIVLDFRGFTKIGCERGVFLFSSGWEIYSDRNWNSFGSGKHR